MKLVYERGDTLFGYFKDVRESILPYNNCVKPPHPTYLNNNWIAQVLVQYFEDFLDPTPEELTIFEIEFKVNYPIEARTLLKSGAK